MQVAPAQHPLAPQNPDSSDKIRAQVEDQTDLVGIFSHEELHEPQQGELANLITASALVEMHSAGRRHRNNGLITVLRRQQQGQKRFSDEISAAEINVEAMPPLALVAIEYLVVVREETRITDEDVQASEPPLHLCRYLLHARTVRHVHSQDRSLERIGCPIGTEEVAQKAIDTKGTTNLKLG
ncbi:hypothetical protein O1611_g5213 [Lasiodiplodia mahajangana]|uniref:Uncharacterized protein n=1 Tax=Lasiodiplodia mahajangana TaxID=1108764 RepID=A0ACC2JMK6_9PEZI|nr:hypothetical protein O1611_g5213 [Lasiodiplodia mahajangana]